MNTREELMREFDAREDRLDVIRHQQETVIVHGVPWTRQMAADFKKAYLKATAEDEHAIYVWRGHEMVPGYAKYVIEYCEGTFGDV